MKLRDLFRKREEPRPDLLEEARRLLAQGHHESARVAIDEALSRDAPSAQALALLGQAYLAQDAHREALAAFERALAQDPVSAEALLGRGACMARLGAIGPAIESMRAAVKCAPTLAKAHSALADLLHAAGQPDEALAGYDRALGLDPESAEAHEGRANVLAASGRAAEALAGYDAAIAIDPLRVASLINRANVLHSLGREGEALAGYETTLALDPDAADAWYNQGVVQGAMGRIEDAMTSYDRAIELQPDHAEAHFNRGIAAAKLNRGLDACASFDAVVAIDPAFPYALGQAAFARAELCHWEGLADLAQRVERGLRRGEPAADPFALLAFCDDPGMQLRAAELRIARQAPGTAVLRSAAPHDHDRIRVAYLSANLCAHAVAYLIAEIFERHDRSRFELTAISFGPDDGSAMLARLKSAFDEFIDARAMSSADVARLLREREIDIAVDLMGFTRDGRVFEVLAHRPCPVQVNMLGYPGSIGADYIDYIVADRFIVPEEAQAHYTEHVVYMPDCYQPNDRKRVIDARTPSRAEVGLPESGFVYCCFNNNYKITPRVFDIWMRLLGAVPGSVLWLLPLSPPVKENLRREAAARGIDPARLVFAPRVPLAAHLARQRLADVFLDTLPYNAHTTASDALWAGLPVVTCSGRSFPARVAGSLLHAVGLPELATPSLEAYEALALRVARDPPYLASLKARLAAAVASAPLFDSERYCRHLEAAYELMMARHGRGEAPSTIAVQALPASSVGPTAQRSLRR